MNRDFLKEWERVEFEQTPIYIRPDGPDWFVPNRSADRAVMDWLEHNRSSRHIENLLKRIAVPTEAQYRNRSDQLSLNQLKECWIHITNRCNMTCRHCMFQSTPHMQDELSTVDSRRIIEEAYALGCRLFFFTGGEPLIAKAFQTSLASIFERQDTHVVLLTNLGLISKWRTWFNTLAKERLHFQVSMDGLAADHDAIRGKNAFEQLCQGLDLMTELGFPLTLSTTVTRYNVDTMERIVEFAAQRGVANVHFLWLFKKGNAGEDLFVAPERIFKNLMAAQSRAKKLGVKIDNIESLRSQVFSCPGTRYDLSNAGWQSIAVGSDGHIYPTPALIYTPAMQCGHIHDGLEQVWKNSSTLKTVRSASLNHSHTYRENAFRYLIGGGDIDHSFIHSGRLTGGDPYVPLYTEIVKWLIVHQAQTYQTNGLPGIKLKMGEKLSDCPAEGSRIFFTHSNCVLSLSGSDTHKQVNRFYSEAAKDIKADILNPICYDEPLIDHIPKEMRYRSYGCGSPVLEANIQPGQVIVDLGSGTGIECFIAGKLTGPGGRVIGIDMGADMLDVARTTQRHVLKKLSFDNIEFKQAFLENLPLSENSVDVVISNCVVNLSPDKRRVFQEVFRILKPGGRLVISDITYDAPVPLAIKYNETLRGECIGGALRYPDLFGLLNDIGFTRSRIEKGYTYRTVKGYEFFAITYQAAKPPEGQDAALYDFPAFSQVMAAVSSEPTCSCFNTPATALQQIAPKAEKQKSGCMVCGAEIVYLATDQQDVCHYCRQGVPANARCRNGHHVCDTCHSSDATDVIQQICLHSSDTDAVALMAKIRAHPQFQMHGPEHHSMVPAVILTSLRNAGEEITDAQIISGIQRGQTIAGGACAYFGACGAAIGVGIAVSVLISAKPTDGDKRQLIQHVTQTVIGEISTYNAPRCCQRDSWLALQVASKLLAEKLDKTLMVNHPMACTQFAKNKECIGTQCPIWPHRK